jgi:hypothetical protein
MSRKDTHFLAKEEYDTVSIAQAVCTALGLGTADDLDSMLMGVELELDYLRAKARNIAKGYRALKALRPAKPRKKQADEDMLILTDLLTEVELPLSTADIIECFGWMGIPEGRVRFAIEMLAQQGKIALGPDGWMIRGERAPAETIG